jgi:hypothetical protein
MPSSTRSGADVFPSGLTGQVYHYAKEGRRATAFGNAWLACAGDKLYVRGFRKGRLELANWKFKKRGTGHATNMLAYLEEHLRDLPQSELYVEAVHNERFANFFRRRSGREEVAGPSFVIRGFTPSRE